MRSHSFAATSRVLCVRLLYSSAASFSLTACSTRGSASDLAAVERSFRLDTITSFTAAGDALGDDVEARPGRRIYIAHQWVVNEIVAAIELRRRKWPALRSILVHTRNVGVLSGTAFVHDLIRRRENSDSKKLGLLRELRRTHRAEAVQRQEFNAPLRATFRRRETNFDITKIESTRVDGSRTFFGCNGDTDFIMAPEYTYHGGHLNKTGCRRAAVRRVALHNRVAAYRLADASNVH